MVDVSVKKDVELEDERGRTYFDCVEWILNHFSDHACYLSEVSENSSPCSYTSSKQGLLTEP